jgi:hypothetical protein
MLDKMLLAYVIWMGKARNDQAAIKVDQVLIPHGCIAQLLRPGRIRVMRMMGFDILKLVT